MPDGRITVRADGRIRRLAFDNQARLNALNTHMWSALPGLVRAAEDDDEVRVLIVTGAGNKAFSAGADISEFDQARSGTASQNYDRLNNEAFDALSSCAKPTVAAIRGYCFGGGLELALCCDLRVAGAGAQFSIPAVKLGIGFNARWIRPLLNAVTPAVAKEILFTGGRYGAVDAARMGLVGRVVGDELVGETARELALTIAANAPLSVVAAKRGVDELARNPAAPDWTDLERITQACFDSADYEEGRRAFAEKRAPMFKGR